MDQIIILKATPLVQLGNTSLESFIVKYHNAISLYNQVSHEIPRQSAFL